MKLERFGSLANLIINHLASAERQNVTLDHLRVQWAFGEYFRRLGVVPLPLRWVEDIEAAYDEMARRFHAAEAAVITPEEREKFDVYRRAFLVRDDGWIQEIGGRISASRNTVLSSEVFAASSALREEATRALQTAVWKLAWPGFSVLPWGLPDPSSRWKTSFLGNWSYAEETIAMTAALHRGYFPKGLRAAREEVRSAAWMAMEAAYWSAVQTLAKESLPVVDHYIAAHTPFAHAYKAGLWCFWICQDEVLAVPRPSIHIHQNELHCEDGPAVSWPGGARYYFWHDLYVPATVVESPQSLTVADIDGEVNQEVRRVMIERFGQERYLLEVGAVKVDASDWGTLYRRSIEGEEDLVMVKVTNATPEPEGTFKDYFLRVPPHVQTAKEAVAWTFGESADDYAPAVQT